MKYFFIMLLISSLIFLIFLLSYTIFSNKSKMSPFECGFDPFLNPRYPFSIRFFKILMIFLLFDIEIILILNFPFSLIKNTNIMIIMFIFFFIILFSLFFEWKEGSLNWF